MIIQIFLPKLDLLHTITSRSLVAQTCRRHSTLPHQKSVPNYQGIPSLAMKVAESHRNVEDGTKRLCELRVSVFFCTFFIRFILVREELLFTITLATIFNSPYKNGMKENVEMILEGIEKRRVSSLDQGIPF
jgi:hypothetical protein